MKLIILIFTFLQIYFLAAYSYAAGVEPNLVLYKGKIFTANADQLWVQAIAIQGERIQAVGSDKEILNMAGSKTRLINLEGKLLIPGINDAHTHVTPKLVGITLAPADVFPPNPTVNEIVNAIANATRNAPAGTWIFGDLGDKILDDPQGNRYSLDKVSPKHPVMLQNFAGHGLLLNTAAMNELGIAEDAEDPLDGWYGRFENTRKLNGLVYGYAIFQAERKLYAKIPFSKSVQDFKSISENLLKYGITSIQDMPIALEESRSLELVKAAHIPLRWRLIHFPYGEARLLQAKQALSNIKIFGRKFILDGTPMERGAFMREAYLDQPDNFGHLYLSVKEIERNLTAALYDHEQPLLHAVGDATLETLFTSMSNVADEKTWQSARVRIEHGDFISHDQMQRAKKLGIVLVQNPTHLALPEIMLARYGATRIANVQPLKSLLNEGLHLALGSDSEEVNPFTNILLTVTHPTNPSEALTREQAVIAYTQGSAYAEFAENEKGILAPGFLADLAVLSQDIFTVPLDQLPQTRSLLTLIGGKIVYQKENCRLSIQLPRI